MMAKSKGKRLTMLDILEELERSDLGLDDSWDRSASTLWLKRHSTIGWEDGMDPLLDIEDVRPPAATPAMDASREYCAITPCSSKTKSELSKPSAPTPTQLVNEDCHKVFNGDSVQQRVRNHDGRWTTRCIPIPAPVRAYNSFLGTTRRKRRLQLQGQ
ncbi:hypothetical protein J4Q44_G00066810 [Coregonus suidteri]|uniref:Uncharacterized protein n=1 Tax=Coregonus suidteri TaxID=861788 RepID=A0AAN8R1Y9_9TELE